MSCYLFSFEALRLWRKISLYSLGGVFWRMGTPKLVEQGASYSEEYKRYPNGFRASLHYFGNRNAPRNLVNRLSLRHAQLRTPATRVPFYFIVTGHTALFDNIKRSNRVSVKVLFYRPF